MIGEKLGPFRIVEKVGAGAMGVVYRATYEPGGQAVAVKVVAEQSARGSSTDRFERESEILKQFKHPGIVQHVGSGFSKSRGLRYYAMEFVPGRTLEQVLDQRGPLPWTEVVDIGLQVCEALQYAHERGIVHRDLKPSNLMVTPEGVVKLTDFGIAKDLDRTALTADGRTLGTAAYMAPEQIRGTPAVSHKTDLYALGCVLYQLLTGRPPYEGKTALQLMHKHLEESAPRASAKNPDVPRALDDLIVSLMAKNRDDRPWDALAAGQTLRELKARQARNEKVDMAFSEVPANPSRLGSNLPVTLESTASAPSLAGELTSGTRTRARRTSEKRRRQSGESAGRMRARLEVGGLVLTLAALTGFAAYMFWPPSQAYLFNQAGRLMASSQRADRNRARDVYMAELDRRFPNHAHKKELQAWRDELMLEDVQRRARFLENPTLSAMSEIKNDVERNYAQTYRTTVKDLESGHDLDAARRWNDLSQLLEADGATDPAIRPWYLLSQQKAAQQRTEIERRLRSFLTAMERFKAAQLIDDHQNAERIRKELLEQYGGYQSLALPLTGLRILDEPGPAETTEPPAANDGKHP